MYADQDGFIDLLVVSGGQETEGSFENLRPRLYLNDGKGIFRKNRYSHTTYLFECILRYSWRF
ncbi:MAG: hypothetical protein U5K54_24085 [Cytophagales bacterium]|nr:hypothetical protein [Cytophagales bacterium]